MIHPLLHMLPQAAPQEVLKGRSAEIAAILKTLHTVFHEVGLDDNFLRLRVAINLGLLWDRNHTTEETASITKCIWESLHAFNESHKALYQHIPPWMADNQTGTGNSFQGHEDEKRPRVYALLQCLYADALSLLYKIHICTTLRSFNLLDAAADSSLSAEDALAQQAVWKKAVSKLKMLCGKNPLYHALMLCQLSCYDSERAIHHLKEAGQQVEAAEREQVGGEGVKVVCTTKSSATFCVIPAAVRRSHPSAESYAVHVKPSETSPSNFDEAFPGAGDVVACGTDMTVCGFKENQRYFLCLSYYDAAGNCVEASSDVFSIVTSVQVPSEMLWGYIALSAAHSQQYAMLSVASKKVFYKFASSNLYKSLAYSAPSDGLQMKEDEAKYGPMPLIRLFTSIILTISYNVELNHSKMKSGSNKGLMQQLQQKQTLLGIESSLYLNANAYISSIVEWISELVHHNILHASRKHSTIRMLLTLYVTLNNTSTDSAGDSLKQQIAWLAYQVQNEMSFSNEPEVAEWVKEIIPQGDGPSEYSLGIDEIQSAMRGGGKASSADKRAAGVLDALFKSSSAEDVLKLFGAIADPWYHRSVELGVRATERLVAKGALIAPDQRLSALKIFEATTESFSKSAAASTSELLDDISQESPEDEEARKNLAGKWLLHHLKRQVHTQHISKNFDHASGWMSRYLTTVSALKEDRPPSPEGEMTSEDADVGGEGGEQESTSNAADSRSRGVLLACAANYSLYTGDAIEVLNTALNYWNTSKGPAGTQRSIPNTLSISHTLCDHLEVLQDSHQRSSCMRFFELVARDLASAGKFRSLVDLVAMLIERVAPKHLVSTLCILGNVKDEDLGEDLRRRRACVMDKLFLEDLLYLKLENCRAAWQEVCLTAAGKKGVVARYRTLAKSLVSHGDIPLLAKCLNDFGDLYASQERYAEAEKEWSRCVDAICGRRKSVLHWREILGEMTIVDIYSPGIGLLIATALGKLAKYCCLHDWHMRGEFCLMAAKILEQMLPHVTTKQMVSYDLPHLHASSMVTNAVLNDLQDCPANDLFSSLEVIYSSLLENEYLSSAVPIAIIMEYVASTVLNDGVKTVHACMLKVTVLSRMGEMDRASVYLQDLLSGGASEGSQHFHRGVRVGENLARTLAKPRHEAFNDREGLGNEMNRKVAANIANLKIPGESLTKASREEILLGQVEWLVKISESCLNSSAQLDPSVPGPTTDASGLESASKHLATALSIVLPIFEGAESALRGDLESAAEAPSGAGAEGTPSEEEGGGVGGNSARRWLMSGTVSARGGWWLPSTASRGRWGKCSLLQSGTAPTCAT